MYLRVGFLLCLLGLFAPQCAATDHAELIATGIEAYKLVVGNLKEGIKGLFIAEELTAVAKTLMELEGEMMEKEEKALEVILGVHTDALLAINQARIVVVKIKNLVEDLLYTLEFEKTLDNLKLAVEIFIEEGKLMEDKVQLAIDKLTVSSTKAVKVDAELTQLTRWADGQKNKIAIMTETQIMEARAKAYGGAAACILAGPFALLACPIAYAVAAGVTEGINKKKIIEHFDKGLQQIDNMSKDIKSIGEKTQKLVERANADKIRMQTIQSQLDQANRAGRLVLRRWSRFFPRFQDKLIILQNSCQEYLDLDKASEDRRKRRSIL